ncbi:MAG: hypothetical protein CVU53_07620, partial [Deltaproteobacteria bacterium HGW-Deltaproteobacteria-11]
SRCVTDANRIDFLGLALDESDTAPATDITLIEFSIGEPEKHNGALYLEVRAADQLGFLAALLNRLAFLFLFPEEMTVETVKGTAVDRFRLKGIEFDGILKSGRTHLQDAVPIRLGQEFEAYAVAIEKNISGILCCRDLLLELGIGGTAVGTGLNAEARYIELVVEAIRRKTGFPVRTAANLIETTQNMEPFVALSSALKGLAINITRIANDLRLLSSGPMTGLNEINLPPVQPGSSIMPGKVNPVIPEMVTMVSFQVMGADTTVTLAAQAGQMELNVMMPVIIYNILFSMEILTNAVRKLRESCIEGITANVARCSGYLESSVGMATVLAPHIGYAAAAEIVKESLRTGRSTKEIILSRKFLSQEALAEIIDPYPLTTPGVSGKRDTKPKEDV